MSDKKVIFNTSSMYYHRDEQTQVYVITGPKGSKIAETLETVRPNMPPDRSACLQLSEKEGFRVVAWPIDPKMNIYEMFAGIARSLKDLPEDKVLCAIIFGEHVDYFGK